jgi:hypothetical protein
MGSQTGDPKESFQIEEIPQPEETLTAEQAEEAQGGIIIIGGGVPILRRPILDDYSCAAGGCSPDTRKPHP